MVRDLELMERLLAAMEVGVGAFTSCDVRRGYDLAFDASSSATVHYCMAGNGELMVINSSSFKMRKHTFVLLTAGGCLQRGIDWKATQRFFPAPPVSSSALCRERANDQSGRRQDGNRNGLWRGIGRAKCRSVWRLGRSDHRTV